jgi:hypothetical protein
VYMQKATSRKRADVDTSSSAGNRGEAIVRMLIWIRRRVMIQLPNLYSKEVHTHLCACKYGQRGLFNVKTLACKTLACASLIEYSQSMHLVMG